MQRIIRQLNPSLRTSALRATRLALARAAALAVSVLLPTGLLNAPGIPIAQASGEFHKSGVVTARGLVLGPNGQPIYAEFDKEGNVATVIGEAVGEYADAQIMAGDAYRAHVLTYDTFMDEHQDDIARGSRLLSREEYERTDFGTVDVPGTQQDENGQYIKETRTIAKPALGPRTESVLVRAKATIVIPQDGPILLESPIDLRSRVDLGPLLPPDTQGEDYIRAVLLNDHGQLLHRATVNIGYRTAYFSHADPNTALADTDKDQNIFRLADDTVVGPLQGVKVYTTLAERQATITEVDGRYRLHYYLSPCPGFTYDYAHDVLVEVPFKSFNPKATAPWGTYYTNTPVYDFCNGLGEVSLGNNLIAQMTQLTIQGIVAAQAMPLVRADIRVDALMLAGEGTLSNSATETDRVPIGETTEYTATPADLSPIDPAGLDLDGDRVPDTVVRLSDQEVGIFFGDNPPAYDANGGLTNTPDVIRRTDTTLDLNDQGLLKTLAPADLEDIDLYVYRLSNDQLITKREGLKPTEYVPYNATGAVEGENAFFYRLLIRGTRMTEWVTGRLTTYQERTQINPDLHGRQADHLRVGEAVKLIALHRKTGYIGTVTTTVQGSGTAGAGSDTASLNFEIDKLMLRPPNLTLTAERAYTVQAGMTKGEERDYLIGAEGAGLTTDTTIVIRSDWRDHDGSPLPADLDGYTGRLAKVTGANQLTGVGGDLALFAIKPGHHMQLIRLSEGELGKEHFYVHVAAQPKDRNPDFQSLGAGAGPLQTRPKYYVPVKVALYDEQATRERRNQLQYAQQDGLTDVEDIPAVYQWRYRPEMQFSVYDLTVNTIVGITTDEQGVETEHVIYDAAVGDQNCENYADYLECLISNADQVEVHYDLYDPAHNALAPFGPQQELLWALGAEENLVEQFAAGQQAAFTDIAHLKQLAAEDLLALQFYLNSDPENVLWEYALVKASITVDSNRDGYIMSEGPENPQTAQNEADAWWNPISSAMAEVTPSLRVRDVTSKDKPFVFWLNDDFDVVSVSGEINNEIRECPPVATGDTDLCVEEDFNNYLNNTENSEYINASNSDEDHRDRIESLRDLEDFEALEIKVKPYKPGKTVVKIATKGLSINLFEGKWTKSNNRQFVQNITIARQQADPLQLNPVAANGNSSNLYLPVNVAPQQLALDLFKPATDRADEDQYIARLIFEGVSSGQHCADKPDECYLEILIYEKENGNDRLVGKDRVYMRLETVSELYEHYTAGDNVAVGFQPAQLSPSDPTAGIPKGFWKEEGKDQYIVFVHGWRMQPWERRRFAETALKRLYWQGYKGRFGFFSWPTDWFKLPPTAPFVSQLIRVGANAQNYDRSEAIARQASDHLYGWLRNLRNQYKNLHIFSHSMGGVVVSETLKLSVTAGPSNLVNTFIASQAAEVASAYDPMATRHPATDRNYLSLNQIVIRTTEHGDPQDLYIPEPDKYTYENGTHRTRNPDPANALAFDNYIAQLAGPNHYYAQLKDKTSVKVLSFYNHSDPALDAWRINQRFKPDVGWHYRYTWEGEAAPDATGMVNGIRIRDTFCDGLLICGELDFTNRQHRAHILARIIEARSNALGAYQNPGGVIAGTNNLTTSFNYRDNTFDHSAQFLSNAIARGGYWKALLNGFDIHTLD